jgi:Protein of unknown function (DUF1566)
MIESDVIADLVRAVREADRLFESSGGGSRDWVRDQFLPQLESVGLVVQRISAQQTSNVRLPPSVWYRPNLCIDGNKWCAFYGENIQEGCAGFGDSPAEAMADFDAEWVRELGEETQSKGAARTKADTATSRYVVSKKGGTVFDNETKLTWQREVPDKEYTHAEALAYAKQFRLDGHDTWRLPTIEELSTIVDFTKFKPAIDTNAFPGTPSEWFWSSSPSANSTSYAWVVNFYLGNTGNSSTTNACRVRCVR